MLLVLVVDFEFNTAADALHARRAFTATWTSASIRHSLAGGPNFSAASVLLVPWQTPARSGRVGEISNRCLSDRWLHPER